MHLKTVKKLFLGKNILLALTVLLSSLLLSSPCFCFEGWVKGKVLDRETGLPIEGVVIVRSWTRIDATPAGAVNAPLGFDETNTDQDGTFSFSMKILPHISIPFLSRIEENKLIAYKPGYKFITFDHKTNIVELEKVPAIYYHRYQELQKAENNYERDYQTTNLFNEVLKLDEKFIRNIPLIVKGVFGFVRSPSDIDFDPEGNIYVSNDGEIVKFSNEGRRLYVEGKNFGTISVSRKHKPSDIEVDESGDIFVFMKNELIKLKMAKGDEGIVERRSLVGPVGSHPAFSDTPVTDSKRKTNALPPNANLRATLISNRLFFLIIPQGNVVISYDLDMNLHCTFDASQKGFRFTDITAGPGHSILASYSHGPILRNQRYEFENGLLTLDQDCREISNRVVNLEGKESKSISLASDDDIIISAGTSLFIFGNNLDHPLKKIAINEELGDVDIQRIKVNKRTDSLYLIDGKYNRVLRYELKTKAWFERSDFDEGVKNAKIHINDYPGSRQISGKAGVIQARPAIGIQSQSLLTDKQKAANALAERNLALRKKYLELGMKSVKPLLAAMQDKDRYKRFAAVWALGEIKSAEATDALILGLQDKEMGVQELSAEALGKMRSTVAVQPLQKTLLNANNHILVRRNAAWALGEIKKPESVNVLIQMLKENPQAVDDISTKYQSYFTSTVIEALGKLADSRALDAIAEALKHEGETVDDREVRKKAAWALGKMKDKRAVRPLADALSNGINADDAAFINKKPGYFPGRGAGKSGIREAIIEALVKCNDTNAVLPLILALKDNNQFVRRSAAHALGIYKDKRSVSSLIELLNDEDAETGAAAAEALVLLGEPSVLPLVEALKNTGSQARTLAAVALGEIKDQRAVLPLTHALDDKEFLIRKEAALALGKIKDARAVPALIGTLKDQHSHVQKAASDALCNIGMPAVQPLINALYEKDLQFRIIVIETLGNIGSPITVPLIDLLHDKDFVIRWIASWLLETIGEEATSEFLEALKNNNPEIRWRVAEVLGNIGNFEASAGLIAMLDDKVPIVRWKAAEALGKIRDPRALAKLSLTMKDEDALVRKSATWAAATIHRASDNP